QFLDDGIVTAANGLADRGVRVVLAGIDMDFRGLPFGPMPTLLAVAEIVDKLQAICVVCGGPASRNQRLVNGRPALWESPTIMVADVLAREAQAPGGEVLAAIAGRFGADVLAADGSLDRAALRGKVMGDQAALDALNQIVHPAVRRRRDELLREARAGGDLLVVNDIPLLFEALDPTQFDAVVLVDASPALRRTRLRSMRGLSNDEADRMIAAQMPAERKRAKSDFVIENEGSLKKLE